MMPIVTLQNQQVSSLVSSNLSAKFDEEAQNSFVYCIYKIQRCSAIQSL